jgi:hypothetical protein
MSDLIIGKDSDGLKHPVRVDSTGAVVISGTVSSIGNVESLLTTQTGIETAMAADVNAIKSQLSTGTLTVTGGTGGGGGGSGTSTIQGYDGSTYRAIKTDTLGNLNVNVLSGGGGGSSSVTLSGVGSGVTLPVSGTVTSSRNWNLATSTDSLTAAISTLPAVSLAAGQSVSLTGGTVSISTIAGGLGTSSLTPVFDSIVGGSVTLTSSSNPTLGAGTNAIGYLTNPSTFTAGQQTVTATAAALPSATLTTGIVLTNNATATVYLGTSGVTSSNGYALPSGASIGLAVSNLNVVYLIGTASTGNLSYIGS